jgi:hypothetical protein
LIIPGKSIHKGKDFTSGAFINYLVDEGCRVVFLWTSLIEIPIVNTDTDGPLFFGNRNKVGDPFYQRDGIDKARF